MPSPRPLVSALEELRRLVLDIKGTYAAKRVEKAADEVPNLEKQYSQAALEKAFLGDNAQSLMTLDPADFQKYSVPMAESNAISNGLRYPEDQMSDWRTNQNFLTLPEIARVKGFSDVPYFTFDVPEIGPRITGHEGRHRSAALESLGDKSTLVRMVPNSGFREGMPRRSQEEYISELVRQLSPYKTIEPELTRYSHTRPAQKLPEQFKQGGLARACTRANKMAHKRGA